MAISTYQPAPCMHVIRNEGEGMKMCQMAKVVAHIIVTFPLNLASLPSKKGPGPACVQ